MGVSGPVPSLQSVLEVLLTLAEADGAAGVAPRGVPSEGRRGLPAGLFQASLCFLMRLVVRRFYWAKTRGHDPKVLPDSWASLVAWVQGPLWPTGQEDPTLRALPPEVFMSYQALLGAGPSAVQVQAFWRQLEACLSTPGREARGLLRGKLDPWAPERLGMLYESLLDQTLSTDASGRLVLEPRSSVRKGGGVFYTPPELCRALADATLEPLLHDADEPALRALRICDPAVGGGALLLAAYRCLCQQVRRHAGDSRLPASVFFGLLDCFYGVDSDPIALELARSAMWLEALSQADVDAAAHEPPQMLWHHFCCGDALLGTWRVRARVSATPEPSEALRVRLDETCLDMLRTQQKGRVEQSATDHTLPRFFHWEVAFPEVFFGAGGFDAVLANPPWEIHKPSSVAFFQQVDPGHARLDKQAALARQEALCEANPGLAKAWQAVRQASEVRSRLLLYAQHRRGTLDPQDDRPFQHQGRGDLNAYKLFLELGWALLRGVPLDASADAQPTQRVAQLGMILPSGIYTDLGSKPLRALLLAQGGWRLLASFENRAGFFPIDGRFRFCLLVAQKGRAVGALRVAFQQRALSASGSLPALWEYPCQAIPALSPRAHALVELRDRHDFQRFSTLQETTTGLFEPLGPGLCVRARRELDLTIDSHRFIRVVDARAQGFTQSPEGHWEGPAGTTLEPLWQGAMIGMLEPSAATWDEQRRQWRPMRPIRPGDAGEERAVMPVPQFLVPRTRPEGRIKLVFRTLSNPTNQRTLVASLLPDVPCGNSLGILEIPGAGLEALAAVGACMTSLVYDWSLRSRMAGTNLNLYLLEETRLPRGLLDVALELTLPVLLLCGEGPLGQRLWAHAEREGLLARLGCTRQTRMDELPGARRIALRAWLDARVARLYGLDETGLKAMLRDCTHAEEALRRPSFTQGLEPKGFWRLDAELSPEERYPARVLEAFGGGKDGSGR